MKNLFLAIACMLITSFAFAENGNPYLEIEEVLIVNATEITLQDFQSNEMNHSLDQQLCRKCRLIDGEEYCTRWEICKSEMLAE